MYCILFDLMHCGSRVFHMGILALVETIGSFLLFLLVLNECAHVEESRFTAGITLIWCNVEESLSV